MAWTSNQSLSSDALQLAVATAFDPHRRQTYGSVLCRQVEIQIAFVCHRRINYFPPKLKSSNSVTLSALVQTPTEPASLNVSSLASIATLPSKSDFELVAREIHPQRVPLIGGNSHVYVFERPPTSLDGVIDRHVILQCVGAGDVVVFAVLPTPDDAASLVLVARDWLELHLDVSVFQRNIFFHTPRKRPLAGLLKHVWLAWRGRVSFDCPLRRSAAGITQQPASGQFARFCVIKVHGLGQHDWAICILMLHWLILLFGSFPLHWSNFRL